jgi:hypothetical protein
MAYLTAEKDVVLENGTLVLTKEQYEEIKFRAAQLERPILKLKTNEQI